MSWNTLSEKEIMTIPEDLSEEYESGMVHSDLVITKEMVESLLNGDVLAIAIDECSIFIRLSTN